MSLIGHSVAVIDACTRTDMGFCDVVVAVSLSGRPTFRQGITRVMIT